MSSHITRRQHWQHLHHKLLSGSSLTVTSELALELLPAITKSLMKVFTQVSDPHIIETSVEDALMSYFTDPAQFDPARSSLFTYLRLRARSYLLNSLGKRKKNPSSDKAVELDAAETVYEVEAQDESDAEATLIERESETEIMQKLNKIITDPTDFRILTLMLDGVRETSAFAAEMAITDLSLAEQKKQVKQCKDRLRKAIQRKMRN